MALSNIQPPNMLKLDSITNSYKNTTSKILTILPTMLVFTPVKV